MYPGTGNHLVVCVGQRGMVGRRRFQVAPTSSVFDYPGDEAKAGTRVCVVGTGPFLVFVLKHRLRPNGIA